MDAWGLNNESMTEDAWDYVHVTTREAGLRCKGCAARRKICPARLPQPFCFAKIPRALRPLASAGGSAGVRTFTTPGTWFHSRGSRGAEEFLNEIGHDYSAATIQMNAISVKAPAVHFGDVVRTLAKHKNREGVTIKRKESDGSG